MNLLALDISTKTGFCTRSASGVWNFTPKKDESKGMRLIRFKSKLKESCEAESVELIVFEAAVSYGKHPNFVGVEMIGVLKLFCEENDIQYQSYMPTSIKQFATGKGNATKEQMILAANPYKNHHGIVDDNHADALHIYHYAIKDLQL